MRVATDVQVLQDLDWTCFKFCFIVSFIACFIVVVIPPLAIGTNVIHDFTAVTFSLKLGILHEKLTFRWNFVVFREFFYVFSFICEGFLAFCSLETTFCRTSCGAKAQQTPSPCGASRGSPNWPKIELSHVVPWSLRTFSENFMQIGLAVFS